MRKRWTGWGLLLLCAGIGVWQVSKPMPPGTNLSSPAAMVNASDVAFLADRSYHDIDGHEHREQQIFDAVFEIIDNARTFVVADFFLFNEMMGAQTTPHRRLSSELAQHLIARRIVRPDLKVLVITDPINEVYGGDQSPVLDDMRKAGIDVVTTNLQALRDSNPAYSSFWRLFIQWWGNKPDRGFMPNPFEAGPDRITLRSWLALLNFKANHRKLVIADRSDGELVTLIASANPHDASSAHSNVALRVAGDTARNVLISELAIARFSGWHGTIDILAPASLTATQFDAASSVQVSYVTEAAIRNDLLKALAAARNGDVVRIAMFYLADRSVIDALLACASRGVSVRLILDPNKDAFGRQKDGVPNRPVANELITKGGGNIDVRWYRTHGEQFHTKLALISHADRLTATLGSANFTRRNLGNYNLESNVSITTPLNTELATQMLTYFDALWSNVGKLGGKAGSAQFTAPFGAYQDDNQLRYWRYRIMEATGLSTF